MFGYVFLTIFIELEFIFSGKIIDKQKMTIQKVNVGETIVKLEHDTDTNVLVASTYHSNVRFLTSVF